MALTEDEIQELLTLRQQSFAKATTRNSQTLRDSNVRTAVLHYPQVQMLSDPQLFEHALRSAAPVLNRSDIQIDKPGDFTSNYSLYAYIQKMIKPIDNALSTITMAAGADNNKMSYGTSYATFGGVSGSGDLNLSGGPRWDAANKRFQEKLAHASFVAPVIRGSQTTEEALQRAQEFGQLYARQDGETGSQAALRGLSDIQKKRTFEQQANNRRAQERQRAQQTFFNPPTPRGRGVGIGLQMLQQGQHPGVLGDPVSNVRPPVIATQGLLSQFDTPAEATAPLEQAQTQVNPSQQFLRQRIQNTPGLAYRPVSNLQTAPNAGFADTGSVLTKNYGRRI